MMKKILSFLLATVLIFAMAVPAFAAEEVSNVADETAGTGETGKVVTATHKNSEDSEEVDTVYLVTVEWGVESDLTYYDGTQTFKWNAPDTKYEADAIVDKGWSGQADVTITVTNKSNAEVTAEASWKAEDDIEAECDFGGDDTATVTIESAADGVEIEDQATGEAKTETINATVTVAEDSDGITDDNAPVGTITVNIEPADKD